jgi:hypothetical protein
MTHQSPSPLAADQTFRVWPMLAAVISGVAAGTAAGMWLASVAGWSSSDGGIGGVVPGVQAGLVWVLASAMGVLVLLLLSGRQASRLGVAVMAGSVVRMLAALTMGLFAFLAFKPEGRTFWACFLLAGLCCLVCETAWAVRQLRGTQRQV